MNTVNILVCLVYICLAILTLYLYKISANNTTNRIAANKRLTSRLSTQRTIANFFLFRYTCLAVKHPQKKYLATQFLGLGIISVVLLHLNKIVFYQIAVFPLSFIVTLIINDIWLIKNNSSGRILSQTEGDIIVQPRWATMDLEQIVRAIVILFSVGMMSIAAYRINISQSNLGQLNIISLIIGLVVDQVAIRPIISIMFIGGFKIAEWILGRERISSLSIMKQMAYQEHLRLPTQNIIVEEIMRSPYKSNQKTNSPLRLPDIVERQSDSNSHEGTLADLLKLHSSIYKSQKNELKVDDISIADKIQFDDPNIEQPNLQEVTSKGNTDQQQNKEEQMEMVELDVLKEKDANEDLYLANIWPSKQLQLPESMKNSPKYKKHKINKKRRVLVLSGNSPYLQYLPNMLKKQQSQNKLKSQSKNVLNNKTNLMDSRR